MARGVWSPCSTDAAAIGICPARAGRQFDIGLMKPRVAWPTGTHRDYFGLTQDRAGLSPHVCTETARSRHKQS